MADICSPAFGTFFNNTLVPLMIYASTATAALIGLSYMAGTALSNPKVTLWSKTEAVQLVVSAISVFFILSAINVFCSINMVDVGAVFEMGGSTGNVYDAAESYLMGAAGLAHHAMIVVRYHLEAYTILSMVNMFECDFSTGTFGWGCLFGYSGTNMQPLGGYGAPMAALNTFFNSSIMAYFSALNFLFILLFVYKGFVFLFLPLGIFLRAMPYLRGFGSLLIAVAMSFLIIYPLMLAVLGMMSGVLLSYPPELSLASYDEQTFPDKEDTTGTEAAYEGADALHDDYFSGNENVAGAIELAAAAFIAAVFMPTVALLATIASINYLARLYGEEIDLSRITQLV